MNDTTYAPDILLALVSTATFGGWGLAGAAVVSLARHSPIVQDGIATHVAPRLLDARRRLPELLTAPPAPLARREPESDARHEAPGPEVPLRAGSPRPRWLEVVNDDMDRAPHTLILGPSGAGKTTLATAIMGDRGGRSVVISPKVSADGWRGSEVITLDDDGSYAPLQAAMRDLEDEKRARVVALRQRGRDALEPLTVVFDELQDLTTHVPEAGEFMVNMASLGREIKMRLVGVGTTDDALNIRGWKASRRNYLRVELDRDRRATLNDGVRTIAVSTRESLRAADAARLRPWRGEPEPARPVAADAPRATVVTMRVPERSDAELLSSLLAAQAAVPAIAPERAERLLRLMSVTARPDAEITPAEDVTVTHNDNSNSRSVVEVQDGNGRGVTVNVTQVATGRTMPKGGGLNVKARRMRGLYRRAGADGVPFRKAYEQYGGSRNEVFKAWQDGKAGRP